MPFQKGRSILILLLGLTLCPMLFAQYGGGMGAPGMPAPGTPGYVAPSGGYKANKALIGGLVGGGAAAGAGLFYYTRHHNVFQGCVGPDGKTLIRDKDGKHFQLQNLFSELTPGEKYSLKAKKAEESSGSTLEVQKVRKDLGRCEPGAVARK